MTVQNLGSTLVQQQGAMAAQHFGDLHGFNLRVHRLGYTISPGTVRPSSVSVIRGGTLPQGHPPDFTALHSGYGVVATATQGQRRPVHVKCKLCVLLS